MTDDQALMKLVDRPAIDAIAAPSVASTSLFATAYVLRRKGERAAGTSRTPSWTAPDTFTEIARSKDVAERRNDPRGTIRWRCPAGAQARKALRAGAFRDGRVINGPAAHAQPTLAVREGDGRMEVKTS
jgi:hypothetical protein